MMGDRLFRDTLSLERALVGVAGMTIVDTVCACVWWRHARMIADLVNRYRRALGHKSAWSVVVVS